MKKLILVKKYYPLYWHWWYWYEQFSFDHEKYGFKIQEAIKVKIKTLPPVKKAGIKFLLATQKNLRNSTLIVKSSAIKNNNTKLNLPLKKITNIF